MPSLFARIPDDRVGVLIGVGGTTKRSIEQRTRTRLSIDPDDGGVEVQSIDEGDPDGALRARDIVLAIGRGFSPARAARLLKPDTYLGIIEIKRVARRHDKDSLWRIRSRLIGVRGQARRRLEDLSGASVSVLGSTVAVIGQEKELESATKAVELLLRGSEHSTVFHLLVRRRRDQAVEAALEPVEPIELE
jgi:ribosomal RNA assembly protein